MPGFRWGNQPVKRCHNVEQEGMMRDAAKHDPEANDPEARLALALFRSSLLMDLGEFGRAARIAPSQLAVYERGERPAPREVLERAAAAAGFPVHLLDPMLWMIRSFRAARRGRSRADRVFADAMASELIVLVRQAADLVLEPLSRDRPAPLRPPQAGDRAEAADLWALLEPCSAAERRMLVEELDEYRSWALCERVAAESRERRTRDPRQALELAELALLIAEHAPGEPDWHSRLRGYALAHVSAAHRACGDLARAEEALSRARELWDAGAAGDPGLLDETALE